MSDENKPAESSPALVVPTEPAAYAEWRRTGELPTDTPLPEKTPKPEAAAPSEKTTQSESAPEADAGKPTKQESTRNAATRRQELLGDLKNAGFTPAELKTFRKQAAEAKTEPASAAPVVAEEVKAPAKPQLADFDDYAKYEEAMEGYHDQMADFRVEKAFRERAARDAAAAAGRETAAKFEAATQHYGAESGQVIQSTATSIFNDAKVPAAVKQLCNESPVIAHLMYVLGSKPEELASFLALAKSNPGEAIRKAVLLENLIGEELGKAKSEDGAPGRDAAGKFTAPATPARKTTSAPPPPVETSGRSSPPGDEAEGAFTRDDFRSFRDAENRKDIARKQGR